MTARARTLHSLDFSSHYKSFDQLDGSHPWMKVLPDGFVAYKVQELQEGKVAYFNFCLAKEMGLIPKSHPHEMTEELHAKLIETFSIQIINEYDELSQKRIPAERIKKNQFMATRYLQLQHGNKQGKTSGDGRGIWNGVVENKGQIWDVSSRGTGVTCLAPGAVMAQKPLKTGTTEFGYGCGQAEIDELIGAAIMAESFYLQGLKTERVLCVIDLGKGVGIGVRAAMNLFRPAHLFLYLKQNRIAELKKAFDFLIDRQIQNKVWNLEIKGQNKVSTNETSNTVKNKIYDASLKQIATSFGEFSAQLENEYVFAWLDWDGDNVLADAGIIDYGSVRQFGIRHDRYRYDDVERFSTNLQEQKNKARLLVQVFAQITDAVISGSKKSLPTFKNHWAIKEFNRSFEKSLSDGLLYKMGFDSTQREFILQNQADAFEKFEKLYRQLETKKVGGHPIKVPDGVNHPALYNMRVFIREMPMLLLQEIENNKAIAKSNSSHREKSSSMPNTFTVSPAEVHKKILSGFAKRKDVRMSLKHNQQIEKLIELYKNLISTVSANVDHKTVLRGLHLRAEKLNSEKRITGNALIQIVDRILAEKKKGLRSVSMQSLIDQLVSEHLGFPEVQVSDLYKNSKFIQTHIKSASSSLESKVYSQLLSLVQEYKEDI